MPESQPRVVLPPQTESGQKFDEDDIVSWTGLLQNHQPDKKAIWTTAFILFALSAVFKVLADNIISTSLIALLGIVVLMQMARKPTTGRIEISTLGVKLGAHFYPVSQLRSFWIDFDPDNEIRELSLQINKWYMPYLRIPIAGQNPVQIRMVLLQYIPEVEHTPTFADALARRLGF